MTKYIACCSFGKDSIAAVLIRLQHGEPIDELLYCKIMFDSNTSAELPEHEEFINKIAIPYFEKEHGLKTVTVQAKRNYKQIFNRKYVRGKNVGNIYGFPLRSFPWRNNLLKVNELNGYMKSQGQYKAIVGIAVDEENRIPGALKRGEILPLIDYNITEKQAFEIAGKYGLISPAYRNGINRLGCWFCHNQTVESLRQLRLYNRDLWQELLAMDDVSPCKFRVEVTLREFEERFASEGVDNQMQLEARE